MNSEFDVVVIGAGVNGLACGAVLAREGLKVCVVERNRWVGGGAVTREITLPGFKHDLYGSSHVWIQCNADFKSIQPELEQYGLRYIEPEDQITGHPDCNGGPGHRDPQGYRCHLRFHRRLFGPGCPALSPGVR